MNLSAGISMRGTHARRVIVAIMLCEAALTADDRSITFDRTVDFSTLKTFTVHETKVVSSRAELDNALFASQISDVARQALRAKGLTEVSDRPDLVVECRVTGQDYSIGSAGRANPIPQGRGPRSFDPVSFTEGTLVIDLTTGPPIKLVWHGVYRRSKDSAAKLAQKLPDEAKKLLSEYPPKKK